MRPQALEQPEEGDLEGEQGGLGVGGLVEQARPRRCLVGEDDLLQRALEVRGRGARRPRRGRREDREGVVQLAAHAGPLGALAGEQEGELAAGVGAGRARRRSGLARRRGRSRPSSSSSRSRADDDGAVLEGGAGGGQGVGDVGEVELGLRVEVRRAAARPAPRRAASVLAESSHGQRAAGGAGAGVGLGRRGSAAGASSRMTWALVPLMPKEETPARRGRPVRRPGAGLGEQLDRARRPVDVRGGLVDVQGLRQDAVPHRQHHLDDAGDAGGGLGVADVGLERAEPQRAGRRPVLAVGGEQGLRLDRVAERGAGAVGLDRVDVGGRRARRWPAPGGSPAAGRGRWAR